MPWYCVLTVQVLRKLLSSLDPFSIYRSSPDFPADEEIKQSIGGRQVSHEKYTQMFQTQQWILCHNKET